MATTWIDCEGKRILYTDFRDCESEAEVEEVFEKAVQLVLASPEPVLTLNNFEGIPTSGALVRKMRNRGLDYQHKVRAKAVLGATGIKKTLLDAYCVLSGIEARAFATEAEAIAYLVAK